jgi:hypothetical protein
MRRISIATAFQSITPLTPRVNGLPYNAFLRYREIPDLTPFVPPEDQCTIDDPLDSLQYESLPGFTAITQSISISTQLDDMPQ